MKTGMCRDTGAALFGVAYLRQRLADVINTPLGSLVGRRDFGSNIHEMVDKNVNRSFYMHCYMRLAEAINNKANGLEDFRLIEMQIERIDKGHFEFVITGELMGANVVVEGIKYNG